MKKKQSNKLTYREMENIMRNMGTALQESINRITNLEYYISSYIEFRKTGKRYGKWMEKKHQEAKKAAETKNELRGNEEANRRNLEGTEEGEGRRPERIRTP